MLTTVLPDVSAGMPVGQENPLTSGVRHILSTKSNEAQLPHSHTTPTGSLQSQHHTTTQMLRARLLHDDQLE